MLILVCALLYIRQIDTLRATSEGELWTLFTELFKKRIDKKIIVHPKGYSEADGVIKIPPYMMYLI
ncbi:MAG: hypothetical protein J5767_14480 [Paludibacteraceae bacterium]|nr:hypothetical protein [Paludibacteraceae bacterium]